MVDAELVRFLQTLDIEDEGDIDAMMAAATAQQRAAWRALSWDLKERSEAERKRLLLMSAAVTLKLLMRAIEVEAQGDRRSKGHAN